MSKQNKSKKQHFIPQYYLNKFASKKVPRGKDKYGNNKYVYYTWMYNKKTQKQNEVEIKDVGQDKNFYDIPQTPLLNLLEVNPEITEPAYLENKLWKPEDYESSIFLNEVLKKLEKNSSSIEGYIQINNLIEENDKDKLIMLIVSQLFRTPKFRNLTTAISNELSQKSEMWSTGEKTLDNLIKLMLEEILRNPNFFHANNYICNSDRREDLFYIFKERAFIIGINTTNQPFFTSDHPVVVHSSEDDFKGIKLIGEGLELYFPLSPKFIVLIIEKTANPQLIDDNIKGLNLDLETVNNLNKVQVFQSDFHIYTCENKFNLVNG